MVIFHSFFLVYQAGYPAIQSSRRGHRIETLPGLGQERFRPGGEEGQLPQLWQISCHMSRTLLGSPPRSAHQTHQAFFHMNRHKFKPMTSFNLDAPSIKLYVDTTKDPGKTMAGV